MLALEETLAEDEERLGGLRRDRDPPLSRRAKEPPLPMRFITERPLPDTLRTSLPVRTTWCTIDWGSTSDAVISLVCSLGFLSIVW